MYQKSFLRAKHLLWRDQEQYLKFINQLVFNFAWPYFLVFLSLPPGIEEPPLITPAVVGKSGELNCTARGEAEAELKWLANGTEITDSDENFSIYTASNL